VFIIELQSRRVHVAGSTRYPDEAFVMQAIRGLANPIDGVPADGCVLICDRDRKWSRAVLEFLEQEGVRIIRTPFQAPNYKHELVAREVVMEPAWHTRCTA
jgi:putative transposase